MAQIGLVTLRTPPPNNFFRHYRMFESNGTPYPKTLVRTVASLLMKPAAGDSLGALYLGYWVTSRSGFLGLLIAGRVVEQKGRSRLSPALRRVYLGPVLIAFAQIEGAWLHGIRFFVTHQLGFTVVTGCPPCLRLLSTPPPAGTRLPGILR